MYKKPIKLDGHVTISSNDSVAMYLQQAGRHPLLTVEGERFLARLYIQGDDTERHWAKNKLIDANLRLVISIAKKYPPIGGLTYLDYIQAGNLGLEHSIDKFDARKGYKLSTYATFWIRQGIGRLIDQDAGLIKFPEGRLLIKQMQALLETSGLSGSESPEIIAQVLKVKIGQVEKYRTASLLMSTPSIDKPIGEDGSATFGDLVANIPDFTSEGDDTEWVNRAMMLLLESLSPREFEIFSNRFTEEGKMSFRELGDKYGGVTGEAARRRHDQIKSKAKAIFETKGFRIPN